jgi:hypothetical protein
MFSCEKFGVIVTLTKLWCQLPMQNDTARTSNLTNVFGVKSTRLHFYNYNLIITKQKTIKPYINQMKVNKIKVASTQ